MVSKIVPEVKTCPVCDGKFEVGGTGRPPRKTKYCSKICSGSAMTNRRITMPNRLTEAQAAYIAGMIDADGHVGIYRHSNGQPRIVISVSNTYMPMLEWLRDVTGIGSIGLNQAERPGYKASYKWNSGGPAGIAVLQQVIPYMHVKSERAKLAVEYQEVLADPRKSVDLSLRQAYRDQMLAMNRRGPGD
jgi:hypothetical protein